MLSKMKLYSFAASTAAIALMLAAAMPHGRCAGAQVDPMDHIAGGLLWLHDRRLDGEDGRAGARGTIHYHGAALPIANCSNEGGDER